MSLFVSDANHNPHHDMCEPPRKRRAAAVAAQKNWQMLNKPDDEFDVNGEDIVLTKTSQTGLTITTHSPLTALNSAQRKSSFPPTIIIDMAPNKVRRRSDAPDVDDYDYDPHNASHKSKAKPKNTPNSKKANQYVVTNISNKSGVEIVSIDGEQTRVRAVNPNAYRKPIVAKVHANEPDMTSIVDGDDEHVVGTYGVDDERTFESNERTDYLELQVTNESQEEVEPEEDDEVIIEKEVPKADSKIDAEATQQLQQRLVTNKPLIISFNKRERQVNYKTSSDEVIGSLEMMCENVDDDFADSVWIDCEDDILSDQQWSSSVSSNKEYENYAKVVKSAKTCQFLPEEDVKEAVGSVTNVISETTRVATAPTQVALRNYSRNNSRQEVNTSQSFNRPIPSISRVNILQTQRPRMVNPMMNSMNLPLNSMNHSINPSLTQSMNSALNGTLNQSLNPSLNPSLNGTLLLPVANSGISAPVILTPRSHTENVVSNMTAIHPGVQVILSQGPPNQTFIMYPKSTNSSTMPTNSMLTSRQRPIGATIRPNMATAITMPSNLYLPNQSSLLRQNMLNTSNASMATPTLTQQLRAPPPTAAPQTHQYIRVLRTPGSVATRPTVHMNQQNRTPFTHFSNNFNTNSVNSQHNSNIIQSAVAPNNQTLLRNVVLNTDNSRKIETSINNKTDPLYDCLAIIKGNPIKKLNMKTLLTIKPLPFTWPSSIDALISSLIKLDNALMKEKFKESPIAWMVNAQLISPPKCKICNRGLCNQVNRSKDGRNEFWMCNNQRCNSTVNIERPLVFAAPQFDIPVSKLLFIVYYWSIQVDVEDLIKTGQIEMGIDVIYNIWQKLQRVCSTALHNKDGKLGSPTKSVDVASVQIGRFYVVGAMESVSHRCKLAVISISNVIQQNGKDYFLQPIVRWVEKGTIIRTCETKFAPLRDFGYRVSVLSKSELLSSGGNLSLSNIGGYMIHHLQRFFKDMDVTALNYEILSNVLEELLWRERYGTNPYSAFTNIIKHIAEQCGLRRPDHLPAITNHNRANVSISRVPPRAANPPQTTPTIDPNSVFVDEYYYSHLQLKSIYAKQNLQNDETSKDSIQCHLCQMFFDNVLIIKHLLEHLEKERRGRVRKGDNNESECKHCLRFFSPRCLHMHDELTNMKVIPFSCRICALPFYARNPFIHHMKTSHFSGEMPYYCDICSYRSSFQKHLFDHFETTHSGVEAVMCQYCVRIFHLSKHKNLSQFVYRHLATHYAVASVYDCDKCVLTFTTKADLREHCFKGHNPSNPMDEKFEIISYVVRQEESTLCVRAQENELFTPNLPTFGNSNDVIDDEETINTGNVDVDYSVVVNCEPFMSDFLIEPEIQISLTDNNSIENFILPVDSDYTNEQFKDILTKSFDFCDEMPHVLVSSNTRLNCKECNTYLNVDHFMKKGICAKCNYTTHCKKAYTEHMIDVHSSASKNTKISSPSILCNSAPFRYFKLSCLKCKYSTNEGNDMAHHMVNENHYFTICKSLT